MFTPPPIGKSRMSAETYCMMCRVISAGRAVVVLWKVEKLSTALDIVVILRLDETEKKETKGDKENVDAKRNASCH